MIYFEAGVKWFFLLKVKSESEGKCDGKKNTMFGSKSPSTFLTNLFDKGNDEEEQEQEQQETQDDDRGQEFQGRKRSQSMFAPSVAALISGDHVGVGSRGKSN